MSKTRPNMARERKAQIARERVPRAERGEHETWCVREHTEGACSAKRGHWDRSTNTWDSDFTESELATMREALNRWKGGKGEPHRTVMDWLRLQPGFTHIGNRVLTGWWMTKLRRAKQGEEWP